MGFEYFTKEVVDKYQIGTTIIYVIGMHFCTVVTVTKNSINCKVLTSTEVDLYINDLKEKNI